MALSKFKRATTAIKYKYTNKHIQYLYYLQPWKHRPQADIHFYNIFETLKILPII